MATQQPHHVLLPCPTDTITTRGSTPRHTGAGNLRKLTPTQWGRRNRSLLGGTTAMLLLTRWNNPGRPLNVRVVPDRLGGRQRRSNPLRRTAQMISRHRKSPLARTATRPCGSRPTVWVEGRDAQTPCVELHKRPPDTSTTTRPCGSCPTVWEEGRDAQTPCVELHK